MPELVLVTPTLYASTADVRFGLAAALLRSAASRGLRVVLVDDSSVAEVRDALVAAGGDRCVVAPQGATGEPGSKGAALRRGIRRALELVDEREELFILHLEPEKHDLVRFHEQIVGAFAGGARVVVPGRTAASFATYPIEQV